MPRKSPTLSEKLAATLLYYLDAIGKGIPHEHAKQMTTDQILSLVHFDHWPKRVEAGGTNHPSNLKPLIRHDHVYVKTPADNREIAKIRSTSATEAAFRARLLAKEPGKGTPEEMICIRGRQCHCDEERRARCGNWRTKRSQWGSRKFPKRPLEKSHRRGYSRKTN